MDGPLTEEFALTLSEMRIGQSRQEALKNLSQSCDAPELSAFTRAIVQADQFGISLGGSCERRPPTPACAVRARRRSGR